MISSLSILLLLLSSDHHEIPERLFRHPQLSIHVVPLYGAEEHGHLAVRVLREAGLHGHGGELGLAAGTANTVSGVALTAPSTLRVGAGTTDPVWNFPFDPSLDDPDLAGCEGSGTLEVPASGTLRLSFASADALPRGKWPLLTGTSGGEALSEAAWPVVYAEGPRPLNFEVVRDSTGVWLQAFNGTTVIIR